MIGYACDDQSRLRKTRFRSATPHVNQSFDSFIKTRPSKPGANDTLNFNINWAIVNLISMSASCFPIHA